MQRRDVEGLTREELIAEAERLGVPRPRVLTQPELIDEILARSARSERERSRARGFLGRARDLLARVVERGLHLPDAARALRGSPPPEPWPPPPPPLPTVTLAEIYAAQGHLERALAVLDDVLAREPDHEGARQLRARLVEQAKRPRGKRSGEAPPPPETPTSAPVIEEEERVSVGVEEEPVVTGVDEVPAGAAVEAPAAVEEVSGAARDAPAAGIEEVLATVVEVAPAAAVEKVPAAGVEEALATSAEVAPAMAATPAEGESAPLPERYDVDEIVGMAVDPETVYVYWEVRPTTLARSRGRRPGGQLVIRLVAVLPSWDGPLVERRDVPVDALFGDRFVRGIPAGANVRLSVGWAEGDDFEPFAVGAEIAAPRAFPSGIAPGAMPAGVDAVEGATPHEAGGLAGGHGAPAAARRGGGRGAIAERGAVAERGARAGATVLRGALPVAEQAEGVAWSEAPGRFPSGTLPTPEEVARAIAVTRGGASELGREGDAGAGGPGPARGGASELWRGPGGASELWRRGGGGDHGRDR